MIEKAQCLAVYTDAFGTEYSVFRCTLFDLFFNDCKYLLRDGQVVSILFALDIACGTKKGKYFFAAATKKKYRGQGLMRELISKTVQEYSDSTDFFCLRPASKLLFLYYEKLGFTPFFCHDDLSEFDPADYREIFDPQIISEYYRKTVKQPAVLFPAETFRLMMTDGRAFQKDSRLVLTDGNGKVTDVVGGTADGLVCQQNYMMCKVIRGALPENAHFGFTME